MIDIKKLRNHMLEVATNLKDRGFKIDQEKFFTLEKIRKNSQVELQNLQAKKNQLSKQIAQADATTRNILIQQVQQNANELIHLKSKLEQVQEELQKFLEIIPNLLHQDVPKGKDETYNQEIICYGKIPQFDFDIKDHVTLGNKSINNSFIKMMDFNLSVKLAGSRFVVLADKMAKLHRALAQFMLDVHTQQHGYQEMYVPYLSNTDSMYGSGQLPKFTTDAFQLNTKQNFYLLPTAEVALVNLLRQKIIKEKILPIKLVSHTPCFRKESGSYGRDTRGMIRHHQFEKVELVQFVQANASKKALEEITQHATKILQLLELPYKVISLCSGDIGFSASKTYDIEVWFPSQNCYREISSCSNCADFQTRRMQARYRDQDNNIHLLHSLNGSGLAIGRTLAAILENFQNADGSVNIPKVLQPYMQCEKI